MDAESAKLLVVDDDPEILELTQEYLSQQGFAVDRVQSGEAMLEYLNGNSVDLIILRVSPGRFLPVFAALPMGPLWSSWSTRFQKVRAWSASPAKWKTCPASKVWTFTIVFAGRDGVDQTYDSKASCTSS